MANIIDIEGINTKEEAIERLKKAVNMRNKMGGALYWNVLNDDCFEIAAHCISSGCNKSEITKILNNEV